MHARNSILLLALLTISHILALDSVFSRSALPCLDLVLSISVVVVASRYTAIL